MFHRVLGGNHQEGLRQFVGMRVDRYLALIHRFQQGGLRLRRSTIDFVRQQHIGEDWAALELENLFHR